MWTESILMRSVMAKPRSLHFDGVFFFELADLRSWCLSMPGTKLCDLSPSSVSEESNITSEWDVGDVVDPRLLSTRTTSSGEKESFARKTINIRRLPIGAY